MPRLHCRPTLTHTTSLMPSYDEFRLLMARVNRNYGWQRGLVGYFRWSSTTFHTSTQIPNTPNDAEDYPGRAHGAVLHRDDRR